MPFTALQQASQQPTKVAGENMRQGENAMAGAAFKEPKAVYLDKPSEAQPKSDAAMQTEVLSEAVNSDQGSGNRLNPGRVQGLADTEKGLGSDIEQKTVFENALQAGDAAQSVRETGFGKVDAKLESRPADSPVWHQVSSQVISRAKEESSSFQMKLKPDGLGQLTVEMRLENGRVSFQMIADSAAAKDAIVSQLDELEAALRANQVDVFQIQVSVEADRQQQSGSPLGQSAGNESGRGYYEEEQSKEDLRHEGPVYFPQTSFLNGFIDYKI